MTPRILPEYLEGWSFHLAEMGKAASEIDLGIRSQF